MPKGYQQMVAEANAVIKAVSVDDAKKLVGQPGVVFLDVRDADELRKTGTIPGAVNASRGMLEVYADPASPSHKAAIGGAKRLVVNCAAGGRSALACRTLQEMGYADVVNLTGGMNAWLQAGGATEPFKG
ncbi:MAG: rhodanese-like domain-containing protein [Alphaproteobacteria bacterium]|nr:rhodanese-like domain-containing protein [Alphaproteobacteria bacterium]